MKNANHIRPSLRLVMCAVGVLVGAGLLFGNLPEASGAPSSVSISVSKPEYVPGELITVTVTNTRTGTLMVTVFDPRSSADPILDEVVNIPSVPDVRTFTCTTTNVGRYLAFADLIYDPDEAPDTARKEFLVREPVPTGPQITNTTVLMMPDRVELTWSGGTGPFQIQCKDALDAAEWGVPLIVTLQRTVTLPKTNGAAFYRVSELNRPGVRLNIFVSKPLYVPGDVIDVTVETTIRGTLVVDVYDPRGSGDSILDEVLNIPSIPASGVAVRTFTCTTTNEGRYLATADVIYDPDEAPDTARTEFGVRRPELAAVPKEILRTETPALDVPAIRQDLRDAASNGVPALVTLGTEMMLLVNVQTANPLEGGEPPPPALEGTEHFTAKLESNPESAVTLSIGPDAPGGNDLHGMMLSETPGGGPPAITWIEPLRLHIAEALSDVHLVYHSEDLHTAVTDHSDVADHHEEMPAESSAPPAPSPLAGSPDIPVTKNVKLWVYHHPASPERLRSRAASILSWGELVKKQFQNIQPRESTNYSVSVGSVTIAAQTNLLTNGYGGTCESVIMNFRIGNPGPIGVAGVSVLFTDSGTGCGGIARLGSGPSTRIHCMVKDIYSIALNTIVLGQEVGHNWDRHPSWAPVKPHDSHLCECISEDVGDTSTCTIMRATYGTCTKPVLSYSRASTEVLRHLAEGILWYH